MIPWSLCWHYRVPSLSPHPPCLVSALDFTGLWRGCPGRPHWRSWGADVWVDSQQHWLQEPPDRPFCTLWLQARDYPQQFRQSAGGTRSAMHVIEISTRRGSGLNVNKMAGDWPEERLGLQVNHHFSYISAKRQSCLGSTMWFLHVLVVVNHSNMTSRDYDLGRRTASSVAIAWIFPRWRIV